MQDRELEHFKSQLQQADCEKNELKAEIERLRIEIEESKDVLGPEPLMHSQK